MKKHALKPYALSTIVIFLLGACGDLHRSLGMRQENLQLDRDSIAQLSDSHVYTIDVTATQSDSSPLYYVMEKVGSDNIKKWEDYSLDQEKLACELNNYITHFENDRERLSKLGVAHLVRYKGVLSGAGGPLGRFRQCLAFHDRKNVEVWVAYATCEEPTAGGSISDMSNVEMSVAVLTHVKAPFQPHGYFTWHIFFEQRASSAPGHCHGLTCICCQSHV